LFEKRLLVGEDPAQERIKMDRQTRQADRQTGGAKWAPYPSSSLRGEWILLGARTLSKKYANFTRLIKN
jgi:hypothetical protein